MLAVKSWRLGFKSQNSCKLALRGGWDRKVAGAYWLPAWTGNLERQVQGEMLPQRNRQRVIKKDAPSPPLVSQCACAQVCEFAQANEFPVCPLLLLHTFTNTDVLTIFKLHLFVWLFLCVCAWGHMPHSKCGDHRTDSSLGVDSLLPPRGYWELNLCSLQPWWQASSCQSQFNGFEVIVHWGTKPKGWTQSDFLPAPLPDPDPNALVCFAFGIFYFISIAGDQSQGCVWFVQREAGLHNQECEYN